MANDMDAQPHDCPCANCTVGGPSSTPKLAEETGMVRAGHNSMLLPKKAGVEMVAANDAPIRVPQAEGAEEGSVEFDLTVFRRPR